MSKRCFSQITEKKEEVGSDHPNQHSVADITQSVIDAIAAVKWCSVTQIENQIASQGGDMSVTAKEAKAAGAMLEKRYGCEILKPGDFGTARTAHANPGTKSHNRCMDSAEDTSILKIAQIFADRLLSGGRSQKGF